MCARWMRCRVKVWCRVRVCIGLGYGVGRVRWGGEVCGVLDVCTVDEVQG